MYNFNTTTGINCQRCAFNINTVLYTISVPHLNLTFKDVIVTLTLLLCKLITNLTIRQLNFKTVPTIEKLFLTELSTIIRKVYVKTISCIILVLQLESIVIDVLLTLTQFRIQFQYHNSI